MKLAARSMSIIQKSAYILVIAVSLASLTSCETAAIRPVDEEVATATAGYGRAFGRVVFTQDGEEMKWAAPGSIAWNRQLFVYLQSLQSGQLLSLEIRGDGTFFWPLKAGEYMVLAYRKIPPLSMGDIRTTFSITKPGQAVYIGDLHIDAVKSRYKVSVEDNYVVAQQKSSVQLEKINFERAKALMQPEPKLGHYVGVWHICAERSGISCDRNYQGVEPLEPAGATTGYPSVDTLTPLLKWKPSSKAGITYDVAIYDSLTATVEAMGAPRMRGALVAYAEGLHEPQYQLTEPLKPGRKYEWSVRLRDGENVSTWSRSSYFAFFIVGWASGTGQWFGFSTPEQ